MQEYREYPAIFRGIENLPDGDSLRLDVDQGFRDWRHGERFRLYGVDTPEKGDPLWKEAKQRLMFLLMEHGEPVGNYIRVWIRTHKDSRGDDKQEKYGRFLVEILTKDHSDTLNAILVREGLAKEYLP